MGSWGVGERGFGGVLLWGEGEKGEGEKGMGGDGDVRCGDRGGFEKSRKQGNKKTSCQ